MKDAVIANVIRSQIVEDYLDFFENKDVDSVAELFSDDCSIRDWSMDTIRGKEKVVSFFSNIFDSVGEIDVNITHIHEDFSGVLTCEMILSINGEQTFVADIFEFDEEDRIKALRAYKG